MRIPTRPFQIVPTFKNRVGFYLVSVMSEESLYIVYPGENKKRKAMRVVCSHCGTSFLRDKRHTTKSGLYFCSKNCELKFKGTKIVKCAVCGKEIKRKNIY